MKIAFFSDPQKHILLVFDENYIFLQQIDGVLTKHSHTCAPPPHVSLSRGGMRSPWCSSLACRGGHTRPRHLPPLDIEDSETELQTMVLPMRKAFFFILPCAETFSYAIRGPPESP